MLEYLEHIIGKLLKFDLEEWPASGVPIHHAPDVANPRPPFQLRTHRAAASVTTATAPATTAVVSATTTAPTPGTSTAPAPGTTVAQNT